MPSTAQRAALSQALALLTARERNVLTVNRQHGLVGVMGQLDGCTRAEATAELDKIKEKLERLTRQAMRQPPECARRSGSSLAPGEPPRPLEGPLLRSNGSLAAATPPRKRANYKEKPCADCGQQFKPTAGRQTKCPACRGEAPVRVTHTTPTPVSPPPSAVEEPTPQPAPSNGAVPASEYPRLRSELAAIQRQLDDFAAGLDRLMESSANDDTRAKE